MVVQKHMKYISTFYMDAVRHLNRDICSNKHIHTNRKTDVWLKTTSSTRKPEASVFHETYIYDWEEYQNIIQQLQDGGIDYKWKKQAEMMASILIIE